MPVIHYFSEHIRCILLLVLHVRYEQGIQELVKDSTDFHYTEQKHLKFTGGSLCNLLLALLGVLCALSVMLACPSCHTCRSCTISVQPSDA